MPPWSPPNRPDSATLSTLDLGSGARPLAQCLAKSPTPSPNDKEFSQSSNHLIFNRLRQHSPKTDSIGNRVTDDFIYFAAHNKPLTLPSPRLPTHPPATVIVEEPFMSTRKQRAASRANGQKSQGPITTAGKSKSRYNALKHGIDAKQQIMFSESAEDLAELAAEYHELYSPANADERFLVDTLVNNEWRLRRLRCVEADLWRAANNLFIENHPEIGESAIAATPSQPAAPPSIASNAS